MAAPEIRVSARRLRKDLQGVLDEASREGGLVWLSAGRRRFLLVNDPELVREVMVEREDELAKPVSQTIDVGPPGPDRVADPSIVAPFRRALARGMGTERTPDVLAAVDAAVRAETADWRDGLRFRLMPRVRRMAIRIAVQGAFASRLDEEEIAELERVMRWFNRNPRVVSPWSRRLHRLTLHGLARRRTMASLHTIARSLIANADLEKPSETSAVFETLPDQQDAVVSELIMGAVGPLAQTAGWMLWRFATEPAEAELLREEWESGGDRRTQAFVREVTRLHPTNVRITRTAVTDTTAAGEPVPQYTRVILNVRGMQREPEPFSVERWLDGRPTAYISFGTGGRRCLGETIALTALAALLPTLLREWNLDFDAVRATSHGRVQLGDEVTASVTRRRASSEAPPADPRPS